MNRKNIYKGTLSLLVAALFIFSAVNVMATTNTVEKGEASEIPATTPEIPTTVSTNDLMQRLPDDGPIAQAPPGPVIPNGIFDPEFGPMYGEIPEGTYDLWTSLFIPEDYGPGAAKVFLEVYQKCCGLEVTMYETSFEDNFDIYNNWIQVDQDCGLDQEGNVGFFDTFTWSDARASDGDHSFKTTMYDIYKGNQDDYLECTRGFDISDQQGVNVSFDIWVEGDGVEDPGGDYYSAYDYLDFEVYNHALGEFINPDNEFGDMPGSISSAPDQFSIVDEMLFVDVYGDELPGAYKFFDTTLPIWHTDVGKSYMPKVIDLGGGWWHVWYEISKDDYLSNGGDITDFRFRFSWHTDPEIQYEGGYVDNVKVVSLEECEDKIFQTHTQGPVYWGTGPDFPENCILYVDFPLDWDGIDVGECGQKKTCYDFKLWLEVVEGAYYTDYDWPDVVDIPICVGDFYDCSIVDVTIETSFGGTPILPGDIVMAGEDLHITAWVHLQGTVPATDVPVKFTINKKEWKELFFEDFESGTMGWEFTHFGDFDSQWHRTSTDAWSGSSALGCFDKDTNHYKNDIYIDFALHSKTYDVNEYVELFADYYCKFITQREYDYWAVMLSDPATNFVLGNIGGVGFDTDGYQPNWIGPDQPAGKYASFDLMAAYDYWHDVRNMFRNPDGTDSYKLALGFAFWESDAFVYTNNQAEANGEYWSGLYFDDVSVRGLEIGEEIWSDTVIIPEMEPCETVEVQVEMEDVPYSNYLITVDCDPEGGCNNWDYEPWTGQILVVSPKEKMHPKEVESIDLTGFGEGEWVISTSDYDNYIATQSSTRYEANMNSVLMLAPDHVDCEEDCVIDISHLTIKDTIVPVLSEDFPGPAYPAGWGTPGGEFIYHAGNEAGGAAAGQADCWSGSFTPNGATTTTPTFDLSMYDSAELSFVFATDWLMGTGYTLRVDEYDGGAWNNGIWSQIVTTDIPGGTLATATVSTTATQLRFAVAGATAGEMGYFVFDDVLLEGTIDGDDLIMCFDVWYDLEGKPFDFVGLEINDGATEFEYDWVEMDAFEGSSYDIEPDDGWYRYCIDLEPFITQTTFKLRFRMVSDVGWNYRGLKFDDVIITNLILNDDVYPAEIEDFEDTCDDLSNWCNSNLQYGQYWEYDSMTGEWCTDFDPVPVDDALVWTTEILDCYAAYLYFDHEYDFEDILYTYDFGTGAQGFVNKDYPGNNNPWYHDGGWNDMEINGPVAPFTGDDVMDAGLVSPLMDLSGLTQCALTFDYGMYSYFGDLAIEISVYSDYAIDRTVINSVTGGGNDGSTYTGSYVFNPDALVDPEHTRIEFRLTGAAAGSADYYVGLGYGFVVFGAWIDNVDVSCTESGFLEISADGGNNYYVLDHYFGDSGGVVSESYDITPWAGNNILIRFRAVGEQDPAHSQGGQWCIQPVEIFGKQDHDAPMTSATMTGTMKESGWYSTAVKIKITATDNVAMGEIHYILDGVETVVAGYTAEFTIAGNGIHTFEYWGVDALGNEEAHHTVPSFKVDSGTAPTVAITAPEPGIYLFGNKLLSSANVFIIGAFTIEANAEDADSGIYKVSFYLDDQLLGEDTEAPFSQYVALRHMGAGTIKVVAEDFAQNVAEDNLDIKYYKFF